MQTPGITVRRADERGRTRLGWLDSRHTFSFGEYHDPRWVRFRSLRVINDDRVAPGGGFGEHGHRDMEIITYLLDGELAHKDSLGNGSTLRPGDVQRMTAGAGIRHSEFNASDARPVHLLQVWIMPAAKGTEPGYEERTFPEAERRGRLCLIASGDGRDQSLRIGQDADVYAAILDAGQSVTHALRPGRGGWLHVARGDLRLEGIDLTEGDGVAISDRPSIEITTAKDGAELLLFDLD